MPNPAIEFHKEAAKALRAAADEHDAAAKAHLDNLRPRAREHAQAARQASLEAAVKSESAATASINPPPRTTQVAKEAPAHE